MVQRTFTTPSNSRMLTVYGETKSMSTWANDPRCPVSYEVLNRRISSLEWDDVRAVTTPVDSNKGLGAPLQAAILSVLRAGPLSSADITVAVIKTGYQSKGSPRKTVGATLRKMVLAGSVVHEGGSRGGLYRLPDKLSCNEAG